MVNLFTSLCNHDVPLVFSSKFKAPFSPHLPGSRMHSAVWVNYTHSLTWMFRPFLWGWFPSNKPEDSQAPGGQKGEVVMSFTQIQIDSVIQCTFFVIQKSGDSDHLWAVQQKSESCQNWPTTTGWWLTDPSEKYDLVSWDDDIPIWMGK